MLHWQFENITQLEKNQVVVWFIDLTQVDNVNDFYAALSAEEQQHVDNLKIPAVKNEFVITRGYLRQLLAQFLNQSPETIPLLKTEKGKLFIDGDAFQFNVSHTKTASVIAMSLNIQLGIDIESLQRTADFSAVMPQVFTEDEQQYITQAEDFTLAFFQCWTRKEALIKAMGEGMFAKMKKISTLQQHDWHIAELPQVEDFYISLAGSSEPSRITLVKVN